MKQADLLFLSKTFLFSGIKEQNLAHILEQIQLVEKEYAKGDIIISPDENYSKILFIKSGRCVVYKRRPDSASVPLNTLECGNSFGILAVLSIEDFPTHVVAAKKTKLLEISKEGFQYLIGKYPTVARNVIDFLSRKVYFLNQKIATFTADSVEQKLALYLLSQSRQHGAEFDFNHKKTAETINVGRASVYRALEALEKGGLIRYEDKKVYIIDQIGLERI